ncbi:MAG: TfoX/Sxy family protein [Kofleriaceae bacterium]|jgi:TfoX/Sxy family transcriptional regulator of competence genes|nr:TfoX/Sxy family protein [Kofleriaceae bacterium]MBP9172448.1 TfoX/Sxy family protein [Kofleriaceae bacterium]MBP9860574.1 TfoX/Sxy family protein [Kofleriaceae bacterium]
MAYDERIADRVRACLGAGGHEVLERKMFGGLCFMVRGHMCCGLTAEALMVRVGQDGYAAALDRPHARPMTFTGRPLGGFVYVDPPGYRTAAQLAAWIERGLAVVDGLPRRVATKPSRTATGAASAATASPRSASPRSGPARPRRR